MTQALALGADTRDMTNAQLLAELPAYQSFASRLADRQLVILYSNEIVADSLPPLAETLAWEAYCAADDAERAAARESYLELIGG